jgi:hypothetical protein
LEGALINPRVILEHEGVSATVRSLAVDGMDNGMVTNRCDGGSFIRFELYVAIAPCHIWRWLANEVNVHVEYLSSLDANIHKRRFDFWSHCLIKNIVKFSKFNQIYQISFEKHKVTYNI